AVAAIASGVGWITLGTFRVGPWPGLAFHAILGVLLVPVLVVHLWRRFRVPTTADLEGRRTALQAGVLVGTGVLAWRVQQAVGTLLDGERRFTGSRTAGTGTGNDFPVTSWVADDPDPVDPADWRLTLDGRIADPTTIGHEDLTPDQDTVATLDCTSGWYATRTWRGVRIGELLESVGPSPESRWVTVESVTGYRVNLPIEEAREAVLATHVGEDPLDHGHGAPARLVLPGRRGFQWVKWVTRITVRDRPDYGAWVSIFTSGFTRNRR
ncbi:MAG: molybdopterin-dependent oxidoreductase, partial [Halobacteriales archaeon]|nr:molybdopterin-dependent oxidoreductase [Halobacteriales archaeon]